MLFKLSLPSILSAVSTMELIGWIHHFAHLKQRLRCSNGGFKKENESSVDHKVRSSKSELNLQIKDFFLVQKCPSTILYVLSKISCGASAVRTWSLRLLEVFKSKICRDVRANPDSAGLQCWARPKLLRGPCGRALSAYSGGCQCQVMRIGLLSGIQEFLFLHRKSSTHPFSLPSPLPTRHVLGFLGALTIC